MICDRITIGSQADCEDLPEGGTRARLILINYRDVVSITEDNNGIITSIELEDGKTGYEFLGFRADIKKVDSVFKTVLKGRFKHSVGFVIYERTQVQKNNVKALAKGRFIAIIENRGKGENSIEVVGKNVGLRIVGGVIRDAYDNSGMFVMQLQTPDNDAEFEKKLPQNLGYSYEEGLIIISVILGAELETFDDSFDDSFG